MALMTFAVLESVRNVLAAKIDKWFDAQLGERLLEVNIKQSLVDNNGASTQSLRDVNIAGRAFNPERDIEKFDANLNALDIFY